MIVHERNGCMKKKESCYHYQCSKSAAENRSATSKKKTDFRARNYRNN